jgi:hypothetical protein
MLSLFLIFNLDRVMSQSLGSRKLVYFLCGSDDGRNTGTSIIRGLLYQLLLRSETIFERHMKDTFSRHGRGLFAENRFETFWTIFEATVRDSSMQGTKVPLAS